MARLGRLVISVIHQPRSSIYTMFDKLLLLSLGQVMYMGNANEAVDYFITHGYQCPLDFNPSDYFLDILSPDTRSQTADETSHKQIASLGDHWQQHQQQQLELELNRVSAAATTTATITDSLQEEITGNSEALTPVVMPEAFGARFARNFKLLAWRAFTEQRRDVGTIFIKCFFTLFFGSILGGIYSKNHDSQRGISDITGLLFVISSTYLPLLIVTALK